MSHDDFESRFRRPRVVVRETDAYLDTGPQEPGPPSATSWTRAWVQPMVTAFLVGCVAWSAAELITSWVPGEPRLLYLIVPPAMAWIGFRTQRVVQRRLLSGSDMLRFRLVELTLLFLLVKLLSHWGNTLSELRQVLSAWFYHPLSFFDARTLTAYLMGVAGWMAGGATARDLEALTDPQAYVGETPATVRLLQRYYMGAGLLLVFSAVTRVRLPDVFRIQQVRPSSALGHVLLYFIVGLFALGGIQFTHLVNQWQRQRVVIGKGLEGAWLRYTLLLVGIAAVAALVLPTDYTVGLLDVVATAFFILSFVATVLYTILVWPFAMLMTWLMGKPPAPRPQIPPSLSEIAPGGQGGGAFSWWPFLRSLLFWLVFVGSIGYLIRTYLKDRRRLGSSLKRVHPLAWLRQAWQAVRRWWRALLRRTRVALPGLVRQLRRARSRSARADKERPRARTLTLRERVRALYLQTLSVAQQAGAPRRRNQTPYEYRSVLGAYVSAAQDAWQRLTEAFVHARYSAHPVTHADVEASEADAARVQEALRDRER